MPDLFLHIGQGKAGSTAIQSFLDRNAKLLSRFGIVYPESSPRTKLPGALLNGNAFGEGFGKRWDTVICDRATAFPSDNLLFSYEWIFLSIYDDPNRLEKLLDELSPRFNLRIILYIRDITDHFISEYTQSAQDYGISCSPEEFLLGSGSVRYRSPKAALSCIRQIRELGIDLCVRKYRPRILIEDFMGVLLEDRRDDFMADAHVTRSRVNRSLTAGEHELIKQLNSSGADVKSFSQPLANALVGHIPEVPGRKPYMSEELVAKIEQEFAGTVDEINGCVLPEHRLSTDFSIPENQSEPNLPDDCTYVFNKMQLEIIARMVSQALEQTRDPRNQGPKRLPLVRIAAGLAQRLLPSPGSKATGKGAHSVVRTHASLRRKGYRYGGAPEPERFIFICGLHRSGTSIIEKYIARNYCVSVLRADVPENEGQHLQSVFPSAAAYGGPGRFALDENLPAELAQLDDHARHYEAIMADWRDFIVGSAPVLLEKSPVHIVQIEWLRRVFPQAHFLIVARHPVANSLATQKWCPLELQPLLEHWDAAYEAALRDFGDDCTILKYEDFCAGPETSLQSLAAGAGLQKRVMPNTMDAPCIEVVNYNPRYLIPVSDLPPPSRTARQFGYDW